MAEPSQQQVIRLYEGLLAAVSLYRQELVERQQAPVISIAAESAETSQAPKATQKTASDRFLAKAGYLKPDAEQPVQPQEHHDESTMMLSEDSDAQAALQKAIAEADAAQLALQTTSEMKILSVAETQPSEVLQLIEPQPGEEKPNTSLPRTEVAAPPATLSSKPVLRSTMLIPKSSPATPALRKPTLRSPTLAKGTLAPVRPLLSPAKNPRAQAPEGVPPTPSVAAPGESLGVFLRRFRLSDLS